jgi:peptidoglycan/LPS O-acetylase OafA/YrhL
LNGCGEAHAQWVVALSIVSHREVWPRAGVAQPLAAGERPRQRTAGLATSEGAPSSRTKAAPARFVGLDGLRGVAALCVMAYHFTQGGTGLFPSAPAAVDLFFALSGFVIAHTYEPRLAAGLPPLRFIALRVIRLYPLYFAGTVLGLAALSFKLASGAQGWPLPELAATAVLAFAFLPAFNAPSGSLYPLDGPAWSLAFELLANAGFSLHRATTRSLVGMCVFCVPVYAATMWLGKGPGGWDWANALAGLPRVVFSFGLGMLFSRLHAHTSSWAPRIPYGILPAAVLLALAFDPPHLAPAYFLCVVFCFFPVILFAAIHVEPKGALKPFWQWLGGISYALYAIHQPVQEGMYALLQKLSGAPVPVLPWTWLLATAALTIALSHLLTERFDAPVRRGLAQTLKRRRSAGLPAGLLARNP